jgi:hypothetical protein
MSSTILKKTQNKADLRAWEPRAEITRNGATDSHGKRGRVNPVIEQILRINFFWIFWGGWVG